MLSLSISLCFSYQLEIFSFTPFIHLDNTLVCTCMAYFQTVLSFSITACRVMETVECHTHYCRWSIYFYAACGISRTVTAHNRLSMCCSGKLWIFACHSAGQFNRNPKNNVTDSWLMAWHTMRFWSITRMSKKSAGGVWLKACYRMRMHVLAWTCTNKPLQQHSITHAPRKKTKIRFRFFWSSDRPMYFYRAFSQWESWWESQILKSDQR